MATPRITRNPTSHPMKALLLCLPLALVSGTSRAAIVIANYDFSGGDATSSPSIDNDPNSTASGFTAGSGFPGLSYSTSAFVSSPRSLFAFGPDTNGTDEATTATANDYWTFTVTAGTGTLDLANLSFYYGTTSGASNNATVFVRTSLSNFQTTIYTSPSSGAVNFAASPASVDLSAPEYQGLSQITFRIYGWDTNSSGGQAGVRIDDVILTAVPEPSSTLLLAFGATAVLARRTRRAI